MHPKNWLSSQDEDSIARAHVREHAVFEKHLADTLKPWRRAALRHGRNGSGKRLRVEQSEINATMHAAIHHRMLWWETYITRGALDEQISDRVRAEAQHFWRALEEAKLKLNALVVMGERIDVKLRALDDAIELLDIQKHVMNDAIPAHYKLRVRRIAAEIKRALAA